MYARRTSLLWLNYSKTLYIESGLWCLTPLSTIFQLYRYGHFYWWRKQKYPKKPQTCRKSLTKFITFINLNWVHITKGFELTTVVVIGANCKSSCIFNYRTIITTMDPAWYIWEMLSENKIEWLIFVQHQVNSFSLYTLRYKLSTTLYFYRYIFLHQYC